MLTVLIPAHNEEDGIADAIESLRAQSLVPDRIVVVADNCTDSTVEIAESLGVEVFASVRNADKKAGALNQALDQMLNDEDFFLIVDADTKIGVDFIRTAKDRLDNNPSLGAVGGLFYGDQGGGLVGALQRNEYARYSRTLRHDESKVMVLSGTASMFRGGALLKVAAERGRKLPGTLGQVYDTSALTEDNELTIALKTLGFAMVSPQECNNITEVMASWGDLWKQRMRWQRGAIENLKTYGVTETTRKYWFQQFAIGYGVLSILALAVLAVLTILAVDEYQFYSFWLGVTLVFMVERVVTVWKLGWQARLVALPLVIEIWYDIFIQSVFVRSVVESVSGREEEWTREAPPRRRVLKTSIATLALVALALNAGNFPTLASATGFQILALIVGLNTILFAVLGSMKVTQTA